jgi:hypothetical protein
VRDPLLRNTASPRHIANLCGEPFSARDIVDVGAELGLTRHVGLYENHEARKIVAQLMVRTSEPDVVERLKAAYLRLADEPAPNS